MSKSKNRVSLLGNIGQQVETRFTAGGVLTATVSLATNERVKRGEQWEDHTEWHRIVFYGRLAEIVRDYTAKGSKIDVEGKLRTRSWDDKKTGEKRYTTEVIATDVILLDGRRDGQPPATRAADPADAETARYIQNSPDTRDEDIPF